METLEVIDKLPLRRERRLDLRLVMAFFAIYFLWGATFLAIRVAVLEIPPFFTAGLRFFTAGVILYVCMRGRGEPAPSVKQWRSLTVIALCMFVLTYGPLFWASQFVPSSVTAVIEAMLPIIAMVLEVFVFRRQPFRWRMLAAVVSRGTGRAAAVAGHTVAGKTGTTQDYRDAWFIGWIDGEIIGVWLGNDNNTPMKAVQGGSLPARLFHEIAAAGR